MAKTRVHDLAKEYGMTSKEMLGHLAEMKIPAKSPSSTLEDAYVSIVRKKLKPILEARAAEIEAQKRAEAEAKAEKEREEAAKAEKERIAAEKRREKERAEEERRRAAEEAARKKAEEERLAEEKRRKEEEERNRVRDNAPKSIPSFTSLLDQIAQQEEILKEQAEEQAKKKEESRGPRKDRRGEKGAETQHRSSHRAPVALEDMEGESEHSGKGHGKGGRKGQRRGGQGEDRYSRMAREAEQYNQVLEEAREAVEEATRESTGRRKKRKERRKKQQAEKAEEKRIEEAIANDQDLSQLDTVKVPQGSTVAELADLLGVPANDIIKRLFLLGTPLTVTESMSDDLIELVADDLGREIKIMTKEEENSFSFYDDPKDLKPRPPVVTVMGHVDHGKTSLLDAIRHTGVAAGEAGGITQHIGAYVVRINGSPITFLDTQGHAAFTCMRARGAMCTDIAILVVAADDGIMPQTIEAINHAKAANIPIVVAVNKMDKPGANPDRILTQLTEHDLVPAEWGGDTEVCRISAKTGMGIDELLETVIVTAELQDLKANPNRAAKGTVIEARLDKTRGPIATLLVQNGTLNQGDTIIAGTAVGHVRVMTDDKGKTIKHAGPSIPVEITGLAEAPAPGDAFEAVSDERMARQLVEQRKQKAKDELAKQQSKVTLENLFDQMKKGEMKELNILVKADVQGSAEAVKANLMKLNNDEVAVKVIHSGVGAINESDILLASTANAIIVGFNVRPDSAAAASAQRSNVDIRLYSVIYECLEEIEAAMKGMLAPKYREVVIGHAEVRVLYKVSAIGTVAGCYVKDGKVTRDSKVRVLRDNVVIYTGELGSLQRFKDSVKEVQANFECGMSVAKYNDLKEGDIFECFVMEQYRD